MKSLYTLITFINDDIIKSYKIKYYDKGLLV